MIIPVLHRLLIKPDPVEKTTASGIVLAINEKREQAAAEYGEVIALGDTCFVDFKAGVIPVVGDRVAYAKYAGKTVKDVDGTEYLLLNDEDVTCIVKD